MSPLPVAPPPKDSSLYQQLESTTLQTLTADQLDTIRAKTFSQGTDGNEDEYRRILLLGHASNQLSSSGPIPGTLEIVSTGDLSSNATTTLKTPSEGEVWVICGLSGTKATVSNANWQFFVDDGSNVVYFCDFNGTSDIVPINEGGFVTPIYFDSSMTLKVNTTLIAGSYGTINGAALIARVR
jgi:hypothetical protein